jgi:TRAP-type C4-dicarboxylate transport system permease small subunit
MGAAAAARWARAALHGSAALMFALLVGLVLAQVVARKFFEPLVWTEELARYVFTWVAFLGWVIATDRRSHIAITQGVDRAGPRLHRLLVAFSDGATLLLMGLLLWQGMRLVANNAGIDAVSLPLSIALVYAAVPLAAAGVATVVVARRLASSERPA